MHWALAPEVSWGPNNSPTHLCSVHSSCATSYHPAAPPLLSTLQRMGVQAVMLSGDQPATAHAMAEAVGIPPQQVGACGSMQQP